MIIRTEANVMTKWICKKRWGCTRRSRSAILCTPQWTYGSLIWRAIWTSWTIINFSRRILSYRTSNWTTCLIYSSSAPNIWFSLFVSLFTNFKWNYCLIYHCRRSDVINCLARIGRIKEIFLPVINFGEQFSETLMTPIIHWSSG